MESAYSYENTVPVRWMHIWEILHNFFMPHLVSAKTSRESCLFSSWSEIPLNCSTAIWCINKASQFCLTCKIPGGVFCPTLWVINEDVKQSWSGQWPLGYTTSDWPLDGVCAVNHNPFEPCSSAYSWYTSLLISSMFHQFIYGRQCQNLAKLRLNKPSVTLTSFQHLGFILLGLINLCMSRLFKCSLT